MCMVCSGMSGDDVGEWICRQIRDRGSTVMYVSGDGWRNPSFGYTIGLTRWHEPELIMFDERPRRCGAVLNRLARLVRGGSVIDEDDDLSSLVPEFGERVKTLRFPDSATHLFWVNDLYRTPGGPAVPALQVYFPDREPLLSGEVLPLPP